MNTQRFLKGAGILATTGVAAVLLVASPVAAGEVNGAGDPVPGGENGASACAYSGLNDGNPPAGRVQNFGHTLLFWILTRFIHPSDAPFNPGTACNPS